MIEETNIVKKLSKAQQEEAKKLGKEIREIDKVLREVQKN